MSEKQRGATAIVINAGRNGNFSADESEARWLPLKRRVASALYADQHFSEIP